MRIYLYMYVYVCAFIDGYVWLLTLYMCLHCVRVRDRQETAAQLWLWNFFFHFGNDSLSLSTLLGSPSKWYSIWFSWFFRILFIYEIIYRNNLFIYVKWLFSFFLLGDNLPASAGKYPNYPILIPSLISTPGIKCSLTLILNQNSRIRSMPHFDNIIRLNISRKFNTTTRNKCIYGQFLY